LTSLDTARNGDPNMAVEDTGPPPRYIIGLDKEKAHQRSLPLLIAGRRCFSCRQADDERPTPTSKPKQYVERIVEHCSETSDYLLPDTPMKEAIFRVMLAAGNGEATAEQVGSILREKWLSTAYPRDLSTGIIQRLMDQSGFYCVSRLPEPEIEADDGAEDE